MYDNTMVWIYITQCIYSYWWQH